MKTITASQAKDWQLVYTNQAQKDAKKLAAAGLKRQAEQLLEILEQNPFQNPPPYEKMALCSSFTCL